MNHKVNQNGNRVIVTQGKVTSFSDVRENVNGTRYRVANIEMLLEGGEIREASATVWETSFQKYNMKVDETYVVEIEETSETSVYINLLPYKPASERKRFTNSEFADLFKSAAPMTAKTSAKGALENTESVINDFDELEDF
jgi:hypothetical protein